MNRRHPLLAAAIHPYDNDEGPQNTQEPDQGLCIIWLQRFCCGFSWVQF